MNRAIVTFWTLARVSVAVLLVGWVALRFRYLDAASGIAPPDWAKPFGAALLLFGGAAVLACGAMLSTPGIVPSEFVIRGPFRYLRNPMSLAGVAMMLGLGLFCRSISIVVLASLFFLCLHIFVVYVEEPGLAKRFGKSYLDYKHSVNRWIPTFRRPT
jgi:protein-S-isoprenylcysteine O-methyltransferase Ste14